jgi:energy-coupling factor transporter ATP-binding protein EcfA2
MNVWESYPGDYRAAEVRRICAAVQAGECVSLVGLSGAGKSNLLGFLAHRQPVPAPRFLLVDGNRLPEPTPEALFDLIRRTLGSREAQPDAFEALEEALDLWLEAQQTPLCLLLDRFDTLAEQPGNRSLDHLRALRDRYKYQLTFVTATRHPLGANNEFAELIHANTLWLGPLAERDARWSIDRYAARRGVQWGDEVAEALIALSRGYPSFLRAVCEAHALGARLEEIPAHPALRARLEEFWSEQPDEEALRASGLQGHPLLGAGRIPILTVDPASLTAKESLLLDHFLAHAGEVCDKDDLIAAVWPEDQIYEEGVRDSSLAQLIRRLRQKIEPDPSQPHFIQTVAGRGYRFRKGT